MAFKTGITNPPISEVYKRITGAAIAAKNAATSFNKAAAAGPVTQSRIETLANDIEIYRSTITGFVQGRGAALAAYAQAQHDDDPTYDVVTEGQAMLVQMVAVREQAHTDFPPVASTVPDELYVEPSHSPAQTAALRAQATALIATID